MNINIISIGILPALLLTGCTNFTSGESIPQTYEHSSEIEFADVNTDETLTETETVSTDNTIEETQAETEDNYIRYPPTPHLLYNGEIYSEIVGSCATEVDGKLYELEENEIIEPFIDTEKMKAECEYIGQSTPLSVDVLPEHELELASYTEVPCDLYKIDENQILVYGTAEYDVPERFKGTMFYPGTYRFHAIYTRYISSELFNELVAKYYRYDERFPKDNENDAEEESDEAIPDNVFPPEEKIAPIIPLPSTRTYDPDVVGEIIEPLFELDGVAYKWDLKAANWSFILEDKNILLETNDGLINISDYDNADGDEVPAALSDINSLEFVGIAQWHNGDYNVDEYLYRYGDKLLSCTPCPKCMEFSALLRNSDYDPNQYYGACMYLPCE